MYFGTGIVCPRSLVGQDILDILYTGGVDMDLDPSPGLAVNKKTGSISEPSKKKLI